MPAVIGASKIAHIIARPSAEDLLLAAAGSTGLNDELTQIGLQLTEVEVAAGSPLVGQTVADLESGAGGFVVVAIKRPDNSILRATESTLAIGAGDVIVILGHHEALPKLVRRAKSAPNLSYRGARV